MTRYFLFASNKSRPIKVDALIKDVLSTVDGSLHADLIDKATLKLEKARSKSYAPLFLVV